MRGVRAKVAPVFNLRSFEFIYLIWLFQFLFWVENLFINISPIIELLHIHFYYNAYNYYKIEVS